MIRTALKRVSGILAAAALAAALAACGVKSSPQHPEGSVYPRTYPAGGSTGAKKPKPKGDQVSPQGYPLEYPNRPSSQ